MTSNPHNEIANYESQSREPLTKSRQHPADGDLHQASEKGCTTATHIAKAVTLAQVWQYQNPPSFNAVINPASPLTSNERLPDLRSIAKVLHNNHYIRKAHPDADDIDRDLENIAKLLEILHPLTDLESAQ